LLQMGIGEWIVALADDPLIHVVPITPAIAAMSVSLNGLPVILPVG